VAGRGEQLGHFVGGEIGSLDGVLRDGQTERRRDVLQALGPFRRPALKRMTCGRRIALPMPWATPWRAPGACDMPCWVAPPLMFGAVRPVLLGCDSGGRPRCLCSPGGAEWTR
jgi:hypothetical protein